MILMFGSSLEMMCTPRRDRAWICGSEHKTGTVLLSGVLRETTADVVHVNNDTDFEDVPKGSISFWNHVDFPDPDDVHRLENLATARDQELRIIMLIRDPMELILSGYFYHRVTKESWVHRPMENSPMFLRIASVCDDCVIQKYLATGMSYQEMLQDLDPDVGVIMEAYRTIGELTTMNDTVATLRQVPDVARIYDLAQITKSSTAYDNAFTDIFTFLGVDDIVACVALAAKHDLSRHDGQNKHAMAKELAADRDALRLFLQTTSVFHRYIHPFRQALHYTD